MTMLRGALQGVFFLPCKVACLHGVVTLVSFKVLQIELPFFAASVVSWLNTEVAASSSWEVCRWSNDILLHIPA